MSEPNTPEQNEPETQEVTPSVAAVAEPEKVRTGIRPRTAKRLGIMTIILVAMIYGFYWFVGLKGDLQLPSDTKTMISAIKFQEQGSQAVVVDSQGKVTESTGYAAGKSDRDLAWEPKGNRLFFISDRKDESFHIYRWDPMRNGVPDQKSIDKAGRSNLVFDFQDKGTGDLVGLVLVRGTVQEFTPTTAKSQQVMPPTKKVNGDPEGGSSSTFELIYKRYGQSFKSARWFGNRRYIAAVMRREDKGESLIVQDSEPDEKGATRPPKLILIAEKINLAVDPKTGNLVFTIADVLPVLGQDGNPVTDEKGNVPKYGFVHAILMLTGDGSLKMVPIGVNPSKEASFSNPVVSPDGSSLMFLVGRYLGEGNMEIGSLETCPLAEGGMQGHTVLAPGNITDPAFSPDGRKIAYIKQENGKQAIFVAASDGSDPKNLTGSTGDFATPLFSPQYK